MKRPLAGIAVVFCLGIALNEWLALPMAALWSAVLTAWVVAVAVNHRPSAAPVFFTFVLLSGLFAHGLATDFSQPNHLRQLLGESPQNVAVRAAVDVEPVREVLKAARAQKERDYFFASTSAIDRGAGWQPASGQIVVWLDSPGNRELHCGDLVEFRGVLRTPLPQTNPDLFNFRTYLGRKGIFYEARIHDAGEVVHLGHEKQWFMDAAMWLQRRFLASAGRSLEEDRVGDETKIVGLLRALLVGFRPGLTNELAEPFMQTGTLHVFAVSGLHVAVIAGILIGIFGVLKFPRGLTALLSLPMLLIYTMATGAPASAFRAFLMSSVIILGRTITKPSNMLNSIATACLVVLLWIGPMQLFDVGFQLSFLVVIAIALLTDRLGHYQRFLFLKADDQNSDAQKLRRWVPAFVSDILLPDPYLPRKLLPWWRRTWYGAVGAVWMSFKVSAAACIGSIPLIALNFHLFTTINFLSNLVVVPLSSLTIVIGFASFLSDLVWSWLAGVLNNANYALMKLMLWANNIFAALPKAFFYIKTPPVWLVIAAYCAIGLVLFRSFWRDARRTRWAAIVAMASLAVGLAARNADESATLTVLSVGHGSAIFVDVPGDHHDVLIDCGSERLADAVVKPFLRAQGCNMLDTLFLTHPDSAHVGGVGRILESFRPRRIYDNGNTRWARPGNAPVPGYNALRLCAGGSVPIGKNLDLKVLHPPTGPLASRADDAALVMQLRYGLHRVLLMSDAGETLERRLIRNGSDLRSDILITGLHSAENTCSDEFLDAVAAQWVVISCGDYPTDPIPPALIERIRQHGAVLLRTDRDGAVRVQMTPDELHAKSFCGGG